MSQVLHQMTIVSVAAMTHAMPTLARAQSCDLKTAQWVHDQAMTHYQTRAYERALGAFEHAYDLCPYPVFLQSASICAASLGRYARALDLGRRALEVQARRGDAIGGLSTQEQAQLLAHQRAWHMRLRVTSFTMDESPIKPPPPKHTWVAPTLMVAGGLSLIASGVLYNMLETQLQEIEGLTPSENERFDPLIQRARDLQLGGRVTAVTGAGLILVAGTIWLWPRKPEEGVIVAVGPRSVGMRLRF